MFLLSALNAVSRVRTPTAPSPGKETPVYIQWVGPEGSLDAVEKNILPLGNRSIFPGRPVHELLTKGNLFLGLSVEVDESRAAVTPAAVFLCSGTLCRYERGKGSGATSFARMMCTCRRKRCILCFKYSTVLYRMLMSFCKKLI
jgi:hypothetical protein